MYFVAVAECSAESVKVFCRKFVQPSLLNGKRIKVRPELNLVANLIYSGKKEKKIIQLLIYISRKTFNDNHFFCLDL